MHLAFERGTATLVRATRLALPVRPTEHSLRSLSWQRREILAYLAPNGQPCAAALPTLSQAEEAACVRWLKAEAWLDDQSGGTAVGREVVAR